VSLITPFDQDLSSRQSDRCFYCGERLEHCFIEWHRLDGVDFCLRLLPDVDEFECVTQFAVDLQSYCRSH
jgi:hypothetical protein